MIDKLERGIQVVYVPSHANGSINHPDSERGFVTSTNGKDIVFCRFFYPNSSSLRTVANSESVQVVDLVIVEHHPQEEIDSFLSKIDAE